MYYNENDTMYYTQNDTSTIIDALPKLVESDLFVETLSDYCGKDVKRIFSAVQELQEIEGELFETLFELSDNILSFGWECIDGGFGGSGGAWIAEYCGIYLVTSSDYETAGPFLSLDKALGERLFFVPCPNPTIDSKVLSLEKLVDIARGVMDWENDPVVWINNHKYIGKDNQLYLESSKENGTSDTTKGVARIIHGLPKNHPFSGGRIILNPQQLMSSTSNSKSTNASTQKPQAEKEALEKKSTK